MKTRIMKPEMLNKYHQPDIFTSFQQKRMINDKRKTLSHAIHYSYQGAFVKKDENIYHSLINPNKLKQDYDDKIISIGYEYDFKVGDTFEWLGTNTYWLIYLQDITELAYFRGQIRRCRYIINWKDENGAHSTRVALRGPTETKIDYVQKHEISIDNPNYSLNILVPYNDENVKFFQRYTKFYLQGDSVCWRVEAIDKYSTPGIIEVSAVEYFANDHEDDIENGIVGALIKEPESVNEKEIISGNTFIKPKTTYVYECLEAYDDKWLYDKNLPLKAEIDGRKISLKWTSSYSGQFDLQYGPFKKTIIVESMY